MKVRLRGPPEDLKKLDATQLINLLEKFQCTELIVNTGDETVKVINTSKKCPTLKNSLI